MKTTPTGSTLGSRDALRILAVALATALVPLVGCGDDAAADGADGAGGSDGAGGGAPSCGTVSDPAILTLRDVTPPPGSVVRGDVVHGFTIVDAPGIIQELTLQAASTHTAGVPEPAQLAFTITQQGADLVYSAAPVRWTTVPSHVEMSVSGAFETDDGCVFAFPSTMFSYDVEPDGGGEGGAGGGAGEGGSGAGGSGEGGAGGAGGAG